MSDLQIDPLSKIVTPPAPTWNGYLREYVQQLQHALEQVPESVLDNAILAITRAVRDQRTIFVAGNGGSAAIAEHLCCDWTKGTQRANASPLRTHSLTSNVAVLTAMANDHGYDSVFSRQIEMLGKPGDLLLVISASGNSPNILAAIDTAKAMEITTIGLTGFTGGALATRVDLCLHAPLSNYGLVEDCHQILMHTFAQHFVRQREVDNALPG